MTPNNLKLLLMITQEMGDEKSLIGLSTYFA